MKNSSSNIDSTAPRNGRAGGSLREDLVVYMLTLCCLGIFVCIWMIARLTWRIEHVNWEEQYRAQVARFTKTATKQPLLREQEEFSDLILSDLIMGLTWFDKGSQYPKIRLNIEQARAIKPLLNDLRKNVPKGHKEKIKSLTETLRSVLSRDQLLAVQQIKELKGGGPRDDKKNMDTLETLILAQTGVR